MSTRAGFDPLTVENRGPQVGISLAPCAVGFTPKRKTLPTWSAGNFPPLRLARVLRSAGGVLSADAAGPFPLPSFPWQAAQYCSNISLPDAGEVGLIGSFLTVFFGAS